PAKLNLGLEILRKRSDGYHEIRTVMAAIELVDTISIRPTPSDDTLTIDGMHDVDIDDNLIARAIRRFAKATGVQCGYEISVEKRIPSPGGLGGASSDAASTLIALNAMYDSPLSEAQLHE